MEFRIAIVDELGYIMYWCDEFKDVEEIEDILEVHPEWRYKCIAQEIK